MKRTPKPEQLSLLGYDTNRGLPKIQGRMVILARESRGRTQKQLAEDLGISQGELSKIEGGLRGLSEALTDRLSKALHYPPEFFTQDEPIYGAGVGVLFHRKKQDVSAKTLAQVHAKINLHRIHVARLLRAADPPQCKIPQVSGDVAHSEFSDKAIADVARRVRASWMLPHGPIENLCGAIEDAGGVVIPCDFETRQVDAISQWIPNLPPLFFVNRTIPQDRLRWSLAHELGHLVLHQRTHEAIDPTLDHDVEHQANTFASEFLMPERDIKPDLAGLTLARLAILKPYWRVAMQALLLRARDLGQITSRHLKTLYTEMSRAGYRTREPAELDITGESPTILRELLDLHRHTFGYSIEELSQLLDAFPDETEAMYFPSDRPRLQLVV
jgi:Zn-dependent peptidase ImmA (M78 family)/transcriptional regulator with XRE-family HTH domain